MLEILLLSRDPKIVSTIQLACSQLNISLKVCSGWDEGALLFTRCKIYAVVVDDRTGDAALRILSAAQNSSSSRNAVSIALVSRSARDTFGATFVVAKPLTSELALRTLRAAQGQMSSEYRRYFRHPLRAPVTITTDSNRQLNGTSINVSRIGLAVRFFDPEPLATGTTVRARLSAPAPAFGWIELQGRVAWCDSGGRAGLQCQAVTATHRKQLDQCLASGMM